MAKRTKTVEVDIPELSDLPLDPGPANLIDNLCSEIRAISDQIKVLEDGDSGRGIKGKSELSRELRQVAQEMGLPDRVLGDGWDLRRTVRTTEKVDPAKIKMELVRARFQMTVECPKVRVAEDEVSVVVCPQCDGTGVLHLEGLQAAKFLVDQCTDRTESVSVSVYARTEKDGIA